MASFINKIPPQLRGVLLFAGLIGVIMGIPMGYISIKRFVRKVKWENKKDERRPLLEEKFKPYEEPSKLVYHQLLKLKDQIEVETPFITYEEMDSTSQRMYDSLLTLKDGGTSPFMHAFPAPPKLEENAYKCLVTDLADSSFILKLSEYCGKRIFYRLKEGDWDTETFHSYPTTDEKVDIPTCMDKVANMKYLMVWQEIYHQPAISSTISFRSGYLFGRVDVYDINTLSLINQCYILAKNSTTVSSFTYDKNADMEEEMRKSFRRNLEYNTNELLETTFGTPKK